MSSKIRLEPEQGIESGFLAFALGTQAAKYMKDQGVPLDVMIQTFAVALGALIAQREQVIADSCIDTTNEMMYV